MTPIASRKGSRISAALGAAILSAVPPLSLAALPLFAALPAAAQVPCMAHETLSGYLAERFAEQPHGLGLIRDQRVMELFVSERGTWTVVLTDKRGVACMVLAGEDWEQVPAPAAPEF